MSDVEKTVPAKTVFDFEKLSISNPDGPARLKFGVYNNNPRIIVYTNDKNDKEDYGRITAALDPFLFNQFTTLLTKVANSSDPVEFMIDNKGFEFKNGERSKEMSILTTIRLGKDSQGVVWIMVEKMNRPKIRFDFGHNIYHVLSNADGSPLSKADSSKLAAIATAKSLETIYNTFITTQYIHVAPPPKQNNYGNNRGGNGGGYQRGGNGGGYQRGNGGGNYNRDNNSGYSNPNKNNISDEDIGF